MSSTSVILTRAKKWKKCWLFRVTQKCSINWSNIWELTRSSPSRSSFLLVSSSRLLSNSSIAILYDDTFLLAIWILRLFRFLCKKWKINVYKKLYFTTAKLIRPATYEVKSLFLFLRWWRYKHRDEYINSKSVMNPKSQSPKNLRWIFRIS